MRAAMPVQDEAPLPSNPLATLASDYERAVVHIAWALRKKSKERTLLFAWVELLPTEVPPPVDDGDIEGKLGAKSEHRLYVRHVVVPAEQAVRWYLTCRQGTAVLPAEDGHLPDHDKEEGARTIRLGDLGEEPPWPGLVCVEDREGETPFCPVWHECPRVHHLVPLVDFDLTKLWPSEPARANAVAVLSELLHFDLADYPEYLGSVHLVAPNPVFRELEVRREPVSTEGREAVLFRLLPRVGQDIDGLELSVREDRASGVGAARTVPVHRPIVRMVFDRKPATRSESVTDRTRGMLFASKGGIFIDQFQFSTSFGPSPTRVVQVPGAAPYEVPLQLPASSQSTVEWESRAPQGGPRIQSANLARRRHVRAGGQRWFSGAKEEATAALRELLYEAQREVLIVDPYFGAAEVNGFALAVGKVDVPVLLLTSAEVLRKEVREGVEKGDALLAQLKHVASQRYTNKISVRVMTGTRPGVHDRFFVVDDRVWLLGSSLSEFGSRGTMMVALPEPAPVREKLLDAWREAEDLEVWLKARKERQRANGEGAPR
jgi:hypothetical protein